MTPVFDRPTDGVLDAVLVDHADVRQHLDEAWEAAWAAVDPRLLELCRLRVAMLLGCAPELQARTAAASDTVSEELIEHLGDWPRSPRFGPTDRACLAFTEQWVIDVAGMDNTTVAAVRDELGDQGLADFTSALLVIEQRQRLRQSWDALFRAGDA